LQLKTATMLAVLSLGGAGFLAREAAAQQPAEVAAQKELTGKVVGMHEKTLFIEGKDGLAIPVSVNHETLVEGQRVKRDQKIESHVKRELKPGDQVRASLEVRTERDGKVENIATALSKEQQ
jgi:hypothetical protein